MAKPFSCLKDHSIEEIENEKRILKKMVFKHAIAKTKKSKSKCSIACQKKAAFSSFIKGIEN